MHFSALTPQNCFSLKEEHQELMLELAGLRAEVYKQTNQLTEDAQWLSESHQIEGNCEQLLHFPNLLLQFEKTKNNVEHTFL